MEAQNLVKGLIAVDAAARPAVDLVRAHPLFWTPQEALQYLANIGGALQVGIKLDEMPFIADLEAAVDDIIGAYDETKPETGGSWARQLDKKYPIGGKWGQAQRPPEEDERNYYIYVSLDTF